MTAAERGELLHLARASITAVLHRTPLPRLDAPIAPLTEPNGVFVSLHLRGDLRGCVGALTTDQPLYESVARLAVGAALDDHRFAALTVRELPDVNIEISRLTAPIPATPDDIVVGRHGICVVSGDHRGVLLPQVAHEHGWDRDRFLSEGCRKAELPPDAWYRIGIQLLRFEAEIFGDQVKLIA